MPARARPASCAAPSAPRHEIAGDHAQFALHDTQRLFQSGREQITIGNAAQHLGRVVAEQPHGRPFQRQRAVRYLADQQQAA